METCSLTSVDVSEGARANLFDHLVLIVDDHVHVTPIILIKIQNIVRKINPIVKENKRQHTYTGSLYVSLAADYYYYFIYINRQLLSNN